MARVTITDERLYSEIVEYCKENDLKIGDFCTKLLFGAFAVEKYGDTPFGIVKAEPIRPRTEPVEPPKEPVLQKEPAPEPKVVTEEPKQNVEVPEEKKGEAPKAEEAAETIIPVKPRKRRL